MQLFRGMHNFIGNEIIVTTRRDRRPLHTPINIHEEADIIFQEKFGIKFRSQSVFCTGDLDVATSYGNTIVRIEPIGDYEICWSPLCEDFTEITNTDYNVKEFIEINNYQIGNIDLAISSKNEIMLYCESYKAIKL